MKQQIYELPLKKKKYIYIYFGLGDGNTENLIVSLVLL